MSVADLNGDGRLDVLHTAPSGASFWLRSRSGGGFDVLPLPNGLFLSTRALPPLAADLDGDGDLDFLRGPLWFAQVPRGDYDGDADVDGNDFLQWQRYLGRTNTGATGDPLPDGDQDGNVDGDDLAIWRDNFGAGAEPPQLLSAAVTTTAPFVASIAEARLDPSVAEARIADPALPALPAKLILTLDAPTPVQARFNARPRPQVRPAPSATRAIDAIHASHAARAGLAHRAAELPSTVGSDEGEFPPELLDDVFAGL
jgi:hypothetical protein